MSKEKNYWLFQSTPKVFLLKKALEAEILFTFPIKAHKTKIKAGDHLILWQSGKSTGCYALATVLADPKQMALVPAEIPFYKTEMPKGLRVPIKVEYNFWNRAITKEILPKIDGFQPFYAGKAGTNFKATKAQYTALIAIRERMDMAEEPSTKYLPTLKPLKYLNLILQGPPGTGKTYHTVNHALAIIEKRSLKELSIEPRANLRQRFEEYRQAGKIQFLTFHQSYSYEDFVEGIKPSSQDGQIIYGIEDGIFKKICRSAQASLRATILKEQGNNIKASDSIPPNVLTNSLLSKCDKYVLIIDEINRGNIGQVYQKIKSS